MARDVKEKPVRVGGGARRDAVSCAGYKALASSYHVAGELEREVVCLRKAVEVDPRDVEARMSLGFTLTAAGDFAGARESFAAALDVRLGGGTGVAVSLLRSGKIGDLIYVLREKADRTRAADDLINAGLAFMAAGNRGGAVRCFAEAAEAQARE